MPPYVAKWLVVPPNGQISIGKEWAGRHVQVEQVNEGEIVISSGRFIPENLKTFFTSESETVLKEFGTWAGRNPPKQTDRKALRQQLKMKHREKNKKD